MSDEIKHLERTMRNFMNSDMEYEPVLSALHSCFEADSDVCIYLKQNENNSSFFPVKNNEGDLFIPVFLSVSSAFNMNSSATRKGFNLSLVKFSTLSFIVSAVHDISGLVFEPYDFGFVATPPLILDAEQRDHGFPHITLISGDITELSAQAMVCPLDKDFNGSGQIFKKVSETFGKMKKPAGRTIGAGDIMIIDNKKIGEDSFDYDYIMNIVEPDGQEESLLGPCYAAILNSAKELNLRSVMIPCIGTGTGGIDVNSAIAISTFATLKWCERNPDYALDIYFCCPDETRKQMYQDYMDQTFQ